MKGRVLVTGSSGFVGRALLPALVKAGYAVRAAARRPPASTPHLEGVTLPDLAQPIDWAPLLEGVTSVVHLAGIAHRSGATEALYDRVVRGASAELARAAKTQGGRRLIFMSSIGAQAGSAADAVVTEETEPRPVTAYDRAKLAAEAEVRQSGVPFTIFRPVVIYGPQAKGNVARLLQLARLPLPLPFGAFGNRRSFLSLDNMIGAITFALEAPAAENETYVVADRDALTLCEIIATLRAAAGRPARLWSVPPHAVHSLLKLAGREALWDRIGRELVVDPSKLIAAGWTPRVDTRAGLAAMMTSSEDYAATP